MKSEIKAKKSTLVLSTETLKSLNVRTDVRAGITSANPTMCHGVFTHTVIQ